MRDFQIRPNFYASTRLDRSAPLRKDRDWLSARETARESLIVPVWRTRNLIAGPPDAPRAVLLPPGIDWEAEVETALLGIAGTVAYFAADLSALEEPEAHPALEGLGSFVDLRDVGPLMDHDEGGLLAYARGLMWWHARHRFCGVCGFATENGEAGHVRRCTNPACGAQHFPRTDPAVIMLVHDGDECLLGRQPRFMPGMYSTLAGFVEPGESLEAAVAREVLEETGVHVGAVRYHSSQPWPFPASIMLGFHARATSRDITIQPEELEDARWFTRAELLAAEQDDGAGFRFPRKDSIARRLIEDWLHRRIEG